MTDIRIGAAPELSPRPARRRRGRAVGLIVGVVLALVGLAVAGVMLFNQPKPKTTFTVHGSMALTTEQFEVIGDSGCTGRGGYDDIAGGAQVVVTDSAGSVVGVGSLDSPHWINERCVFEFAIPGIPEGSKFYGVEVTHRGRLQYSRADMNQVIQLGL